MRETYEQVLACVLSCLLEVVLQQTLFPAALVFIMKRAVHISRAVIIDDRVVKMSLRGRILRWLKPVSENDCAS